MGIRQFPRVDLVTGKLNPMPLRFMPWLPDDLDRNVKIWDGCNERPLGHVYFGQYFIHNDSLYIRVCGLDGEPYPRTDFDPEQIGHGISVAHWYEGNSPKWDSVAPMVTPFPLKTTITALPDWGHGYKMPEKK